jgi:hypothetical protein
MIFYLTLSPMLRYGLNKDLFPFSSSGALVKGEQYQNSMTYAGTNLVFIFMVMFLGYWYLYRRHHATFHEIREVSRPQFVPVKLYFMRLGISQNHALTCIFFCSRANSRFINTISQTTPVSASSSPSSPAT